MNNVKDNLNIDKNKITNNEIDDNAQSMLNNNLMVNKSNRDFQNIDGKENLNVMHGGNYLKNEINGVSSRSNINTNGINDYQNTNHLNHKSSYPNNEFRDKQNNILLNDKNLKQSQSFVSPNLPFNNQISNNQFNYTVNNQNRLTVDINNNNNLTLNNINRSTFSPSEVNTFTDPRKSTDSSIPKNNPWSNMINHGSIHNINNIRTAQVSNNNPNNNDPNLPFNRSQ